MKHSAKSCLIALAATSCVIGSEKHQRPRDLPQSYQVDRLRILAVKAEPPEARPGETISFEGLVVDPTGDGPFVVWLACPAADESGTGFGCALDLENLDFESATIEELAEAGVIGFEPGFSPAYTAPDDLLEGLSPEEQQEGAYVTIQVTAIPNTVLTGESDNAEGFDFNEVEIAYKRLIVSEATTPNQNPTIDSFLVDDDAIAPSTIAVIPPGETVSLEAVFSDDSYESYEYTNSDGDTELRDEEPYITWYTTGGEMLSPYSVHPYTKTAWVAPETADTSGFLWAVVRDRRGGMTWHAQPWTTAIE
jgi:hypothetical protein